MIEALALPVAAETFRSLIGGRNVLWLVDSDPVLGAAVKGHSALEDVCSGITAFWEIIREVGARVYLDRIPTDGNLSDGPSRAVWRPAGQCEWATVAAKIPARLCVAAQGGRLVGKGSTYPLAAWECEIVSYQGRIVKRSTLAVETDTKNTLSEKETI